MTINEIHDWIDFITNKAQGSYFTPEEKDNCLDKGQMKYFNELYSTYAAAEKMQDALSPFKMRYDFLTDDSPLGVLSMPGGYQYLLGGQIIFMEDETIRYKSLKIVSEDELAYRLSSQLRPVSVSKPVAMVSGKGLIQLYPKLPMAGTIFYLRRPLAPKLAYTQAGRVITYDDTDSVQMEWGESELSEIIIRAIEFLGVSMDDQLITQYADAKSKQVN